MKKPLGFGDLHTQMQITNRLLAAQLMPTMKQSELIKLLLSTGASSQAIAAVVDSTPNAVIVALHRLRKARKKA